MSKIIIFTDGGARGNPGPAALGVYITNENNEVLARIGKYLGETTNNVAEYMAIIEGFSWLLQNKDKYKIEKVVFYMDSQLAVSQLTGLYKVKNSKIRDMVFEIRSKETQLQIPTEYNHITRDKNKNADLLVNIALDNVLKSG